MTFVRDHALWFAAGYLLLSFLCTFIAARLFAYGQREVPVVYDREREYERDVDPGDGYMGSEAHNSGHGAHWGRM